MYKVFLKYNNGQKTERGLFRSEFLYTPLNFSDTLVKYVVLDFYLVFLSFSQITKLF